MAAKNKSVMVGIGGKVNASLGKSVNAVGKHADKLNKQLAKAKLGERAAKDLLRYQKRLERLNKAQKEGRFQSEAFSKRLKEVERGFDRASKKARTYGVTLKNATSRQRQFANESVRAERAMRRTRYARQGLSGLRRGAAYGGAAAAGAVYASGGLNLERESLRLGTLLGDKDLAAARSLAEKRGGSLDKTPAEMLAIQYGLNSAGFSPLQSREGSKVVAMLSKVTGGQAESTAELLATVFNNMGEQLAGTSQEKLNRIGDLLTKTQFKFPFRNLDQLGASVEEGAATMSGYNIRLDQGLTLLGALNRAGLKGGRAGTAMSATVRNLSKAGEEFGFDVVRDDKGFLDVIATIKGLGESIGGFKDIDQETIDELQQVFGEEGIRGAVLLGKQLSLLSSDFEDVTTSTAILLKSFGKMKNTNVGDVDQAKKDLTKAGNKITEALLPIAAVSARGTSSLIDVLTDPKTNLMDSFTPKPGESWDKFKQTWASWFGGSTSSPASSPTSGVGMNIEKIEINVSTAPGASGQDVGVAVRGEFEDLIRDYNRKYEVGVNGQ